MALMIVFGVILLQKVHVENFRTMFLISALPLELTCAYSLYLLTAIAWERYMAITKWIEHTVSYEKPCPEIREKIALLAATLTVLPQFCLLETPGIYYSVPDIYCLS